MGLKKIKFINGNGKFCLCVINKRLGEDLRFGRCLYIFCIYYINVCVDLGG